MKTRLLIALFLLGLAPALAVAGAIPNEDAQKRTAETIVAFSADHDIGKAKAGYRAALKLDSNYAPARYGLGLMLEAEEDWKGAREAFQQVVKNPKSGSFSAAAQAELADIEKTANALKTPEGRKRLAYDDLIAQARLLLRSKQIPEAAKRAAEARKLDDGRWEAYMVAGEAMQAAGHMPEATRFFNAAAKRAPGLYKENLAGVAREWQAAEEEAGLWKKAESGNDKSALETYLSRYPSGRHFAEASATLKAIRESEERAKAERQRQQAEEAEAKQRQEAERQRQQTEEAEAKQKQEAEFWKKAESDNNERSYKDYLNRYSAGRYVKEAMARLKELAEREEKLRGIMVTIPGKNYEIGKYEITQAQWEAVMESNPSGIKEFQGKVEKNLPVEGLKWDDIQEYLKRLSQKTGKNYRLPTGAEWEYACYGGNRTKYCGSDNFDSVGWDAENSKISFFLVGTTHPVGQKRPNGYGLYDMSGNVSEVTSDCWEGNCEKHVARGGTIHFKQPEPTFVDWFSGGERFHFNAMAPYGFRLARTLP